MNASPREATIEINAPYGPRRLSFVERGDASRTDAVLCVHGLTRNGRDFDWLAAALAAKARVVCPDLAGRGRSDWLAEKSGYTLPTHITDIERLLDSRGIEAVDWVGTSMGGLIGMMVAAGDAGVRPARVRRLIMNDIGPFVPKGIYERLAGYVGLAPRFPNLEAVADYFRQVHGGFGSLAPAQWLHLARHGAEALEGAGYRLAYDPAIGDVLRAKPPADVDMWEIYERVRCPVLVLRGSESPVLTPEIAREMSRRGPRAEVVEIPGVGHAPALMDADQIGLVADWLEGGG